MKKLFALYALSVSFGAFGQSWYIKPTVGVGRTKLTTEAASFQKMSGFFKGEMAVGRDIGKIRIETGLGILNAGFELNDLKFEDDFNMQTGQWQASTNIDYNYTYAYLPVRVGYRLNIVNGLSFVPTAGVSLLYNIHTERTVTTTRLTPPILPSLKSQVSKPGALADILFLAEYKIGSIAITAGASYKRMVSPINKNSSDRFQFLSGDAGILYHF